MRSILQKVIFLVLGFCMVARVAFPQSAPALGPVYEFSALASKKVLSEGRTVVHASVGTSDGPIEGFPPGEIRREKHERDAFAKQAVAQALDVQAFLASQVPTATLGGGSLSGKTIMPGVYRITDEATLTGKLTFNGDGEDNPLIIIQVDGDLEIQRTDYEMLNGAGGINLFWVVDGDVKVSRGASALGNIFATGNIQLNDGAQLQGRLIAPQGEIKIINSVLSFPADLEVKLSKTPGSKGTSIYNFGETITYTITVRNNGPVNENGVVVDGIQFTGELLSATSSLAGATFSGGKWTIGNLAYKETATLTITARINITGSGYMRALVYGFGIDEIRTNNTADLNFCVLLTEIGSITGPRDVCKSERYIYSIAPVEGATRYTWNVPSGWSYTILEPTSIQVTAGANAGFVKVTASNTCGEGPARSFEVTSQDAPPAKPLPISGPGELCGQQSGLAYSIAPVANATSYTWTVPEGWKVITGQGTTEITVNTAGNGGEISVQPANSCGTGHAQARNVSIYDGVPAAPAAIRGAAQGCVGTIISYEVDAVAGAGADGYTWRVPSGWTITAGQGTRKITVKVGSGTGDIAVQAASSCGMGPAATLAVQPVTAAPAAPGPITGAPLACAVEKGLVYSVSPVATALSYDWRFPAGWEIISGAGTNQVTVNASGTGGEVSVATLNSCDASARTTMTVQATLNAPAAPEAITGVQFGCASSSGTYSIVAVSGASSYVWTVPAGWSITDGQGSTSIQVTVGTGTGSVTVKAVNACGAGPEKTLSVTPVSGAPAGVQLSEANSSVCVGATFTVEALQAERVEAYTWQVPSGWAIVSGQGTAQLTVKANSASGTVRLTASNGCGERKVSKEIVVSTLPPATPGPITGTAAACESSIQTYSIAAVSGATSYTWAVPTGWSILKGQGTTAIEVRAGNTTGNVTVTTANGCGNSSQSAVLAVAPTSGVPGAIAAIKAPQSGFCQGTANLSYSVASVSKATTYVWTVPAGWSITSGQGTSSILVKAGNTAGDITVTAANDCGAGNTKAIQAAPQTLPVAPVLTAGPRDPCLGSSTTYAVSGTGGIDAYVWEVPAGWEIVSGQGTASIEVKVTRTAGQVKVTASNSCGGSSVTALDVTPAEGVPAAPGAVQGPATVCTGSPVSYRVSSASSAVAYTWSVPTGWAITAGQGSAEITVVAGTGAGTVAVAAVSGCGGSQKTSMEVRAVPVATPSPILDRSTPCAGLVYEVEAVTGATAYVWAVPVGWTITAGQGTPRIAVTPGDGTGTISLTVGNGTCNSGAISITPDKELAKTELSFPNVFSPNNDGNNDTWVIRNIQNYPKNELTVLNRWGNEVYKAKGYQNSWHGDNLSEGTYFYVARVQLCDGGEQVFKGFVTIVR
ncbi:ice-binding family protein [Pontibacter sp. E15-1]|uniref:ice-binding family protein n=1 Tax=Pontibacter sp. E15-1 TaxID=2919918 RepID=UPI001F4FEB69|nr:ice-binding family protein [Pontibacter sp. E15-1]MCJ8163926.1 ice-binding family protein [Pontibacter sp. E15-1]